MPEDPCPFCEIAAGRAPATIVHEWSDTIAIVPLNPVVDGHTLVIPKQHVRDFASSPTAIRNRVCSTAHERLHEPNELSPPAAGRTRSRMSRCGAGHRTPALEISQRRRRARLPRSNAR